MHDLPDFRALFEAAPGLYLVLISTVLTATGYVVRQAANGEEAMAAANGPQRIDLLITDVVMPGLSGPYLVAQLGAGQPDLVALFMSGYNRELIGVQRHMDADRSRPKAS